MATDKGKFHSNSLIITFWMHDLNHFIDKQIVDCVLFAITISKYKCMYVYYFIDFGDSILTDKVARSPIIVHLNNHQVSYYFRSVYIPNIIHFNIEQHCIDNQKQLQTNNKQIQQSSCQWSDCMEYK